MFIGAFFSAGIAVILLAMPRVVRAVIAARHAGFHLVVRRTSGSGDPIKPSYGARCSALFVVLASLAAEAAFALFLSPRREIGGLIAALFVINPAVAAMMLKAPFLGFRLGIERQA